MEPTELTSLIEKYLAGSASEEERKLVLDWYRLVNLEEIRIPVSGAEEMAGVRERMLGVLQDHIAVGRKVRRLPFYRWTAAAAVLLLVIGGVWFYRSHSV